MEIAPGVHQLNIGRVSNVFLVMEPVPTLIDSGIPRKGKKIADALGEIGLALGDVRRLILTHWHLDHIPSAYGTSIGCRYTSISFTRRNSSALPM